MREKINKLAKGNIDDVKPLIRVIPERLDFVTQKGELIKADVLLKTENHVPMKALAYSSDPRAKVVTPSFGGETAVLHLQFNYAIYDTEGSFSGEIFLITNGGEISLPYTVTIKPDKNEEFLHTLGSVEDFDKIVRADEGAALKLFQYKNFTDADFMQDPTVYMIYCAFSGRPDKLLAMHQFILAVRKYNNKEHFDEPAEQTEVRSSAQSAGAENTRQLPDDVQDGRGDSTKTPAGESGAEKKHGHKYYFAKYYRTRLNYEIGGYTDENLVHEMQQILDAMSVYESDNPYITLLKADNEILLGDTEKASSLLDSVRSRIQNNRQLYLDEYFLLEFINCRLHADNSRRASYIRLLYKFISEENKCHLFMYLVRIDDALRSDAHALYEMMHRLYDAGYRSPFLYLEYVKFLNAHPDYLHDPTGLDIHALFFGCRNDMLSAQLIAELTNRAALLNLNNPLYYPIFTSIYQKTHSSAILQAICSTLIRSDRRDKACHHWYAEGVKDGAKVNAIYEYYLYSLPEGKEEIDEAVLVHFSRGDSLDTATRAKLYAYIVENKDASPLLYDVYEPKIRDYALSGLKEHRVNNELTVLYRQIFSQKADLEEYYDCLPEILCTHRYKAKDDMVKAVVAVYPQLRHEQVFALDESRSAFVPIISDDMVVLAQDAFGNRYCDRRLTRERLFDEKNLMEICSIRCPDNLIVQLIGIDDLLKKDCTQNEQIRVLEKAAETLPLSRIYKASIDLKLIDFYDSSYAQGFRSGYMQDIRKSDLNRAYRSRLVNAQIRAGLYQEAYSGVCADGYADVESGLLREMCSKLVMDENVKQQEQFLAASYETLHRGCYDKVTLDYLCEHFNGSSSAMYEILQKAIDDGIDTYDLEERLLAQLIFIDDTKLIDQVFTWYVQRKRASEQIIKAYFTIRTYRYFLYDEPTDKTVFEYIESVISGLADPAGLPIIHQFALTRFYSQQDECSEEQVRIAQTLINSLFLKGYSFPYFKKFSRYFELPSELQDDTMAVYVSRGSGKPYVMTKLEPGDTQFKLDSMKRMYRSIYVLDKILFDDEKLSYEIYETEDGIDTLKQQGVLEPCSDGTDTRHNRLGRLNEMIRNCEKGDELTLRRNMDGYMISSGMVSKLFGKKKAR